MIGHVETPELREAVERAALVAERANRARDLVNMPPNELSPAGLAERAEELAAEHEHLTAEVLGPEEMRELGMGALLAVGRGSRNEPRLIVLRYEPPQPARADVVLGLVGKAITFDAGGISLKPGGGMQHMKGDMAGGAGTLHGIGALAALGTPVRALAVIASAENLPDGGAFRPGDILRAANGKTIEVINTDAEGRLVLADALWYARREGATHVLDVATLTGAMELALGDLYGGVFANDDALARPDRRGGRPQRRPRLAVPAAPALPPLRRLRLRGHEEQLDAARRPPPRSPPSSCRSSRARARGRTWTWPGRASSSAPAATICASRAAPATASG